MIERRALGYDFSLTVRGHATLAATLEPLLAALPPAEGACARWVIEPAPNDVRQWRFAVDGAGIATTAPEHLVGVVVHTLNRRAVESWEGVACHAGGVSRDGLGVLLPADMESGKSTLTTGLVRAGFDYFSDEAVGFRPGSPVMVPYPKAISLDPGSWFLFPDLEPRADFATDAYRAKQWQVPPGAIRTDPVAAPCPVRLVVFPRYVDDGATALTPMSRAEAVVELAKNTFGFDAKPRAALEDLAHLARASECFRLDVADLGEAVTIVESLVDERTASSSSAVRR
jgi:hypothetical protein